MCGPIYYGEHLFLSWHYNEIASSITSQLNDIRDKLIEEMKRRGIDISNPSIDKKI